MKTIPATEFDKMMSAHQKKAGDNVIVLGPGIYETRGDKAWWLPPNVSLVGSGMGKTIIKRVDPKTTVVVNAWVPGSTKPRRITDLTIDANGALIGPDAASGIAAMDWQDSSVERVQVIGLASFRREVESFGVILSNCERSRIKACVVDRVAGGYVTAFCVTGRAVGITECTASFTWRKGWDARRVAFATAGSKIGTVSVRIANNRSVGALYGVFCDTGPEVDSLLVCQNSVALRSWGNCITNEVRLRGDVVYRDVRIEKNKWNTK